MICRHSAQTCCPFNIKFAQELKEPAFQPREFLAKKDACALAEDLLAISQDEFSTAFRRSPMKRAKPAGSQCNAAGVPGDGGTSEDFDALTGALDNREPSTE